ncbi:MAG: UDP-N-acetylmuramate--L-alanine ligase [Fidelibacterota bacterium]
MLKEKKHIHFIGIGGIGMSGLALLLHSKGFGVTGSDIEESDNILRLKTAGIQVVKGHFKANIQNPDLVVYSAAIPKDNIEYSTAAEMDLDRVSRAELLAEVCQMTKYSVAVAGTHGKTTTTALLGFILQKAGLNPVVLSGGILKNYTSNIVQGGDFVTIVEADEYDQSFLKLSPDYTIITNIDADHMECYGNMDNLLEKFTTFANQTKTRVILCHDDKNIQAIKSKIKPSTLQYSVKEPVDIWANTIDFSENETTFQLNGIESVTLPLQGRHNVLNSLAAIAVALEFDISHDTLLKILPEFHGVERRLEIKYKSSDHLLIDDYAHHPREITATIKALHAAYPQKNILAIFQPHLYSRTQYFYREFAVALNRAEKIILAPIYPAREKPIPGVTSEMICQELLKLGHENVANCHNEEEILFEVTQKLSRGDIVITLGAGNIYRLHEKLKKVIE